MSNRLAAEASPYLQQHAENPVNWYPWDAEALTAAAERDVPILLSIGYSSCHWCHVMAHESFEDADTAAYMNEHFVNIKVDREERPDIDAIYMEAAQAMSGHGGWPLTAFLAPDQTPFFAGTYFPPDPRPNMPSFMQLMESIVDVWTTQRQAIVERGDALSQQLSATARLEIPDDPISADTLDTAAAALHEAYDQVLGGFGGAPKFPPHSVLEFLLGRADAADRELALETLRKIAAGGIHDQLAGGFSRYSVDDRWHIPHFEKMLYDNALLARRYLQAWQVSGEQSLADVARSTLDWMLAEMSGPEGGFASALDADSPDELGEPVEGAFYAWEIDELRELVDEVAPGQSDAVLRYWGVIDHGEFEGKNVLFVAAPGATSGPGPGATRSASQPGTRWRSRPSPTPELRSVSGDTWMQPCAAPSSSKLSWHSPTVACGAPGPKAGRDLPATSKTTPTAPPRISRSTSARETSAGLRAPGNSRISRSNTSTMPSTADSSPSPATTNA